MSLEQRVLDALTAAGLPAENYTIQMNPLGALSVQSKSMISDDLSWARDAVQEADFSDCYLAYSPEELLIKVIS
jgi:hypothetical protein